MKLFNLEPYFNICIPDSGELRLKLTNSNIVLPPLLHEWSITKGKVGGHWTQKTLEEFSNQAAAAIADLGSFFFLFLPSCKIPLGVFCS